MIRVTTCGSGKSPSGTFALSFLLFSILIHSFYFSLPSPMALRFLWLPSPRASLCPYFDTWVHRSHVGVYFVFLYYDISWSQVMVSQNSGTKLRTRKQVSSCNEDNDGTYDTKWRMKISSPSACGPVTTDWLCDNTTIQSSKVRSNAYCCSVPYRSTGTFDTCDQESAVFTPTIYFFSIIRRMHGEKWSSFTTIPHTFYTYYSSTVQISPSCIRNADC